MTFKISELLNRAASEEGTTPYISRIMDNLLVRLVEMKKISGDYLLDESLMSEDSRHDRILEDKRVLRSKIERVFGAEREYEEEARMAFEEAHPEAIEAALFALVHHVLPGVAVYRDQTERITIPAQLERADISPRSRMGMNIKEEVMKVFDDIRARVYMRDFGDVFDLDICKTQRQEYDRANAAIYQTAFEAGKDKGRLITYKSPEQGGPS